MLTTLASLESTIARDVTFELNGASAVYGDQQVLTDIDLTIRTGECVILMGRSGAGKTTLLNLLHAQAPGEMALVPQAAALVKPLSVFHNVYMGRLDRRSTMENLRTLIWPRRADIAEIRDVLHEVELIDKIFARAGALSGGQQQRTSVARALYNGRPNLLADEPVSSLDRVQGGAILKLLKRQHRTLVLVLHDVALALEHGDRIVVLEEGRKVLDQPSHTLTSKDLFGLFGGVA